VATHYGFCNTIVGVGILNGDLATGSIMGAARQAGVGELVWAEGFSSGSLLLWP
jgi:hypothetical protein